MTTEPQPPYGYCLGYLEGVVKGVLARKTYGEYEIKLLADALEHVDKTIKDWWRAEIKRKKDFYSLSALENPDV